MVERKIKAKTNPATKQYRQRQLSQEALFGFGLANDYNLADSSYSNDGCNAAKLKTCSVKMALLHRSMQTRQTKIDFTPARLRCEHVELLQSALLLFPTAILSRLHCCAQISMYDVVFFIHNSTYFLYFYERIVL